MNMDRPCIVLNCSQVREMDSHAIHMLLCCLEEAMKRNGDVRLAGVSEEARKVLASVGADRLFDIFASNADAANSFHQPFAFGEIRMRNDTHEPLEEAA